MAFFDDEDGWTVVRRGRRQRRPGRSNFQQQRVTWGMDRARPPTFERGGRSQFSFPNRPVPPSGSRFRGSGPPSQSYADVVRRGRPQDEPRVTASYYRRPRLNWGRQWRPQPRWQQQQEPMDQEKLQLVRKLHTVIRLVHHLQNVTPKEGREEPRMIVRMVENLASMIKPALPTPETLDLILGNAKNWGYTTLMILEKHYSKQIDVMRGELAAEMSLDWNDCFQMAVRRARRDLPHITQEVLDHAEALVTACAATAMERVPQPAGNEATEDEERGSVQEHAQPPPRSVEMAQQTDPQPLKQRVSVQVLRPAEMRQDMGTMTEERSYWTPVPSQAIQQEAQVQEEARPAPPLQQRPPRARGARQGCVIPESNFLLELEELDSSHEGGQDSQPALVVGESPRDSLLEEREDEVRQDRTPILVPTSQRSREDPGSPANAQDDAGRSLGMDSSSEQQNLTSTPKQYYSVKRHIHTERKMIDWGLSIRKKWVFLGDSNLARFPAHVLPDLQIDSFPGANFRHAQALVRKATIHSNVEKVVLAFGLNNKNQGAKETAIKQMLGAVRAAKNRFPFSEIWIPLINFSSGLSREEIQTLTTMNAYISRNLPFIPKLSENDFRTERDDVHWTRTTARAMFRHWVSFLNLRSP
ncbi:immunoglobulin superfamily member 9B [Sarotherodon galilaeus]